MDSRISQFKSFKPSSSKLEREENSDEKRKKEREKRLNKKREIKPIPVATFYFMNGKQVAKYLARVDSYLTKTKTPVVKLAVAVKLFMKNNGELGPETIYIAKYNEATGTSVWTKRDRIIMDFEAVLEEIKSRDEYTDYQARYLTFDTNRKYDKFIDLGTGGGKINWIPYGITPLIETTGITSSKNDLSNNKWFD